MATLQDWLDGADGLVGLYSKVKMIDDGPVEATAPLPQPDRAVTSSERFNLSQYGFSSSLGVAGLIAIVYLLATR